MNSENDMISENNFISRITDIASGGSNLEIAREKGVWYVTVNGFMYRGDTLELAILRAEKHQRL